MTNVVKMRRPKTDPRKSEAVSLSSMVKKASPPRAFPFFDTLAEHLKTFLVAEDSSEPHLCRGEYAVVDTSDRAPVHGELFLWQSHFRARPRRIVHVTSSLTNITGPGAAKSLVYWMGDLRGFRRTNEQSTGVPLFAGLSDGPYKAKNLSKSLIGRVVGVATSALGGLLEPEAGWEDEEIGNSAFDPGEYLDTIIAAGYVPSVWFGSDARLHYCEFNPERRQTKAEERAVTEVRWKYARASTALDRVRAECLRRGLMDEGLPAAPRRRQAC